MTSRAVLWNEGVFLRPHHFQASHRHLVDLGRRNHSWDVHFNWGLRSIDIDTEALANHQLVIHSLNARLRDGTVVMVPEDGPLPPVDLRRVLSLKDARDFTVFLAVPSLHLGRRNLSRSRSDEFRYREESIECEDENSGGNSQTIPVRGLNFQIIVGKPDQPGFETLPIARLERSGRADAGLQVDASYFPPLLSCDAWKPLAEGVMRGLYERLDKKIEWLAQQMTTLGITFDRMAPGDALVIKQLQQLNEAISVLGVLISAPGIHPLDAYLELSRIAGQLAIFGATRRVPDLPRYHHDDLGPCFIALKQHLDAQLDIVVEPEYKERPFIGAGSRMQVALEPNWLEPTWQLYIGVQSTLEPGQCVAMLTKAGRLDMKIGSSDRVEDLYRQGAPGLRFTAELLPPQMLPKVAGQVYFQITADPKNPEWPNVKKSLSLALRLNENLIVGTIQNQRRLTIRANDRNVSMQFSLYVVPQAKSS